MWIGQPISKDVKLASTSCNIFWWQMLQFISDTQPLLSPLQEHVTGLHVRMSQYVLRRLREKSQVKLLTSHSTAGPGQYSSAKMKCRINPSSDQIPQKGTVVLDCSQQHHAGLMSKLVRCSGEDLHAHIPPRPC